MLLPTTYIKENNFSLINLLLVISTFILPHRSEAQEANKFFNPEDLTITGVYYYPEHWDPAQWERDFSNMSKMGFEFTHFAEFAWAQLEPEEGKYDFAWLDKSLELAAKYHLKVVLCTSTATPPVWLVRKHPDVLQTDEKGNQMDNGSRQHATFSSNYYRMYSLKMIEKLLRRQGIPVESYPEGIIVEYRDGFGIAVNYSDIPYQINLPAQSRIIIGKNPVKTADVLIWKY